VQVCDYGRLQQLVSDDKPHAPCTDAFSVGKIILFWLNELGASMSNDKEEEDSKTGSLDCVTVDLINTVAIGLTEADPSERWTLDQALHRLTKNVRRFDGFESDLALQYRQAYSLQPGRTVVPVSLPG
jgi:hypothetical protein